MSATLPRDSRLIALLLTNYCDAVDPVVVSMLTEYAHRYAREILADAQVYAEHASKSASAASRATPGMNDVRLAIQAKVEHQMSTTWPKEFLLSLAASVNKEPLPALPESYGVRLPPESERLTALNFDLIPKARDAPNQPQTLDDSMLDADGDEDDGLFGADDQDEEMEDATSRADISGNQSKEDGDE